MLPCLGKLAEIRFYLLVSRLNAVAAQESAPLALF